MSSVDDNNKCLFFQSQQVYNLQIIKMSYFVLHFILCLSLYTGVSGTAITPQFLLSTQYIETGSIAIDNSAHYQNPLDPPVSVQTFSLTFIRARATGTRVSGSIQTIDYQVDLSNLKLNITVFRCSSAGPVTDFCVFSTSMDRIKTLRIRYIVLDVRFKKFRFYLLSSTAIGSGQVLISQSNTINNQISSLPVISQVGVVRSFLAIVMLDLTLPSNGCFDLKLTGYYSMATYYTRYESSCLDSDPIRYYRLGMTMAYYNEDQISSGSFPAAKIYFKSFDSPAPYVDSTSLLRDFNTFWGLYHLDISDNTLISWNSDVDTVSNEIKGERANGYNNLKWWVLIIEIKACTLTETYYLTSQDLCFDVCPQKYYANNTDQLCNPCVNYDCSTCDNITGDCLSCNDSYNRVLVGTRCVAIDGYFDNGTDSIEAQSCNLAVCKTCSSGPQLCTGCFNGTYLSGNICDQCLSNCSNCISAAFCDSCDLNFINLGTQCLECSSIDHCLSCNDSSCTLCDDFYQVFNSTFCSPVCGDSKIVSPEECDDGNTSIGDGCSNLCTIQRGFQCLPYIEMNPLSYYQVEGPSMCSSICGDGVIVSSQSCDDNNTQIGDGCSSICQVEEYFICNETSSSGHSLCFLTSLNMSKILLLKDPKSNKLILNAQISPKGITSYLIADWISHISISSPDMIIMKVQYDPSSSNLQMEITYQVDIQQEVMQFNVNEGNAFGHFRYVSGVKMSFPMVSDDNLGLYVYAKEDYDLSVIVKYVSTGIGAFSMVFVILSLFGGRIIGLQTVEVIQITFFSLITLDKMSPTVAALSGLGLSAGYNRLKAYDLSQKIQAPFKAIQWEANFIFNFNLMSLFMVIPLLVSLVAKILIKCKVEKHLAIIALVQKQSLFQYTLYGYLVNAYNINISLVVSMLFFGDAKEMIMHLIGVVFGVVFLLFGALLTYFFVKEPEFFGQFKNKFSAESFSQLFYLIYPIERLLNSIILVTLFNIPFQNAGIMLIFFVIFIIIFQKRPYEGQGSNIRPLINQITILLIQAIFLFIGMMNNPKSIVSIYGPLGIQGLLIVTLIFNLIYWIKNMRNPAKQQKIENEDNILIQYPNRNEFEQLKATLHINENKIYTQSPGSFMNAESNEVNNKSLASLDNQNERMLQLSSIKNQLSKQKLTPESMTLCPIDSINEFFLEDDIDYI